MAVSSFRVSIMIVPFGIIVATVSGSQAFIEPISFFPGIVSVTRSEEILP